MKTKLKSIIIILLIALPIIVKSQENKINNIKGVFIYNFAKEIKWVNKTNTFKIAFYGNTAIYDVMLTISEKRQIGNRDIVVEKWTSQGDINNCNILFVPEDEQDDLNMIKTKIQGKGILLVTDFEESEDEITGINIIEKDNKLIFRINETLLLNEGFKIALNLLSMAEKVY